jgi:hypothetical protein
MLQRIQSVFLFVSLCFLVPLFFVPIAILVHETGEIFTFNLAGFYRSEAGETIFEYSILAFGILICALNLIIILMYRRRILQIRLCIYNIVFLIGLSGVALFVLYNIQNVQTISFGLPAVFPVVSIILHYLAFRGIRKDELTVKSLSRLR